MIEFKARLYDATNEVWIDNNYKEYSIAFYEYNQEDEGYDILGPEIIAPFTLNPNKFSHNETNNFTAEMVYTLLLMRQNGSNITKIRLCVTSETENYFEYDYLKGDSIYLCTNVNHTTEVAKWARYDDTGMVELQHSRMPFAWTNMLHTENLNPVWGYSFFVGTVCRGSQNESLTNGYRCSYESLLTNGNSDFLVSDANRLILTLSGRQFFKSYDGTALCCVYKNVYWSVNDGPWTSPISFSYIQKWARTRWNNTELPISSFTHEDWAGDERAWHCADGYGFRGGDITYNYCGIIDFNNQVVTKVDIFEELLQRTHATVITIRDDLYPILKGRNIPIPVPPTPDEPSVDPDNVPPVDEEPTPSEPDNPDPYYDPESDPNSPDYEPTKDPTNPSYDPTIPATPYNPPSTQGGGNPVIQPSTDVIDTPETPISYVTSNDMFTLYNPSGGDLTNLATFLWSNTWSLDTFKKIFANPMDCILGLMVMPHLDVSVSTKVMNIGNVSSGVTLHYFTTQFYDFDCGTFDIEEYYKSYLDYSPYTKINIFLPFIGDQQLNTDEVMNKQIGVKYRFDIATGDCIAFITVDGSVMYSFAGNCAARLPISGNNWNGLIPSITGALTGAAGMAAGVPALGAAAALAVTSMKETIAHSGQLSGAAGLMGVLTPYLIISRPRQVLPLEQNSFTGYPSFITESLSSLTGYTEVESCHIDHIPATAEELKEIEMLLKGGVIF